MIANILAETAIAKVGPVRSALGINILNIGLVVVMLAISIVFIVLIIRLLVGLIRYFKTAGNEQKLIRMELGKLADEVQQLRQERKGVNNAESSTD